MSEAGTAADLRVDVPTDQLVSFRATILGPELGQRLNRDKKTIGSTAKADLSRYYVLLKIGRDSIAGQFSSNEMNLIAGGVYEERRPDLFDLGWWDYDAARMQKALLIAKIEDAVLKYSLQQTYDADASALVKKIDAMNPLQVAALVDTIERYWSLRPKSAEQDAPKAYEALDFITSDGVSVTKLPAPKAKEKGASKMPEIRNTTVVDTVRDYTNDPDMMAWNDNNRDQLHIKATLAGERRHITIGDVARHGLDDLDDQQRADVIAHLFRSASAWPAGTAHLGFERDGITIRTPLSPMVSETDLYVYVDGNPVSEGVRISTPMVAK